MTKLAVYGVPRSGKDHLIERLRSYAHARGVPIAHIPGSETLRQMSEKEYGAPFSDLGEPEKDALRREFAANVSATGGHTHVVVDGHYAFSDGKGGFERVFTEQDRDCYDAFAYLDADPKTVVKRLRAEGDTRTSEREVGALIEFEIEGLTKELMDAGKELHVLRHENDLALDYLAEVLEGGHDSWTVARRLFDKLTLPKSARSLFLLDGDKTTAAEDASGMLAEALGGDPDKLASAFAGDRYTGYQAFLAQKALSECDAPAEDALDNVVGKTHLNDDLLADLATHEDTPIVILTAGSVKLWEAIAEKIGLACQVIGGPDVTKYAKAFLVRLLQRRGVHVISFGDSPMDGLMLEMSDWSYIVSMKGFRKNVSAMLDRHPAIRQLSYGGFQYAGAVIDGAVTVVTAPDASNPLIRSWLRACKSDSGTQGLDLRVAHYGLGRATAKMIAADHPGEKLGVVILMRSGLPYGMGVADGLDCPVWFMYGKDIDRLAADLPPKGEIRLVVCDGVVNTGATARQTLAALAAYDPVIATCVLSRAASTDGFGEIYAARTSGNFYVGTRQTTVVGGKGPDTSDRLFRRLRPNQANTEQRRADS